MSTPPPSSFRHPGPPPRRPELPEGVWRPEPEPPAPGRGADFAALRAVPLWAPLVVALAALVSASIGFAVIVALAGLSTEAAQDAPGPLLGATFLQDLVLVGGALLVARMALSTRPAERLGLRTTAFWPAVGWAALIYFGYWVVSAVVLVAFGQPPEQDVTQDIRAEDSLGVLIAYALLICMAAPIAEELFFRGLLFGALAARLGIVAGALATGVLFSLVHAPGSPAEALIVLFVLGAGLCLLLTLTGSLLPCIGIHALNNSISFAVTKEMAAPTALLVIVGSVAVSVLAGVAIARFRAARPVPA